MTNTQRGARRRFAPAPSGMYGDGDPDPMIPPGSGACQWITEAYTPGSHRREEGAT